MMVIWSFKLTKRRLVAMVAAAGTLLCAIIILVAALKGGAEAAGPGGVRYNRIKTEADRIAFIGSFGWQVRGEPELVEEIVIPKEFSDVYQEYNALQAAQGLDLAKYCG
ncbi:DUF4830 domain-containing protein, partial [Oscillospiraceae bacterium OttesenSCG-928-F05]|nr:DUF4830 domain-containing protein [Oscillospiraceae bacterium OttesenSCG-928-F05]